MSTLLSEDFASDVSAFGGSGAAYSSAEGPDFQAGIADFSTNNGSDRATLTFTEQSSGFTQIGFWVKVGDTNTVSGAGLSSFIYFAPSASDPNSVTSATSATSLNVGRDSGSNGATSTRWRAQHRNSSSYQDGYLMLRDDWHHFEFELDHANNTYDFYTDGRLIAKNQACSNSGSATVGQIIFLNQSASATTLIDRVRVTNSATSRAAASTTLLLSHDLELDAGQIEALTPELDLRNVFPQPWKVPDDTTSFGAFTVDSNGAVPDSNKLCGALVRGTSESWVRLHCTAASSGTIGADALARVWAGLGSDSFLTSSYDKSRTTSNNELQLRQGSTSLGNVTPDDNASITAGVDYTIDLIPMGRYLIARVNGTQEIAHTITSTGTGARGQLSEEHIGFMIDTRSGNQNLGATNYIRKIEIFGNAPRVLYDDSDALALRKEVVQVGNYTMVFEAEGLLELYDSSNDNPQRNLVHSKGIQAGHLATADPNKQAARFKRHYKGPDVSSWVFRTHNLREEEYVGYSTEMHTTVTPRGVYIRESLIYYSEDNDNYTLDHDFRTELWSNTWAYTGRAANGTKASGTPTKGFADWSQHLSASSAIAAQVVTTGTNKTLCTMVTGQRGGDLPADSHRLYAKRVGNLDPFSIAMDYAGSGLDVGDVLTTSQIVMYESGTSVAANQSFREAILDDFEQPAALTVTTGSLNTAADGDDDTDGYNERHGWYELTASSNAVAFAFDNVTDRVRPQFHVASMTTVGTVLVDGTAQTLDTDYWATPDGAGGYLVGFTGTLDQAAKVVITKQTKSIFG